MQDALQSLLAGCANRLLRALIWSRSPARRGGLFLIIIGWLISTVTVLALPPAPPSVIRVVMDDNYPPFTFRDDDGKLRGISVDQWRLWERHTGIKVEISGANWGDALQRMRAGEFDVIDTIFKTDERTNYFDFTPAYARVKVPIFFRREISGITDLASLKGFPVAAKRGDAAVDLLRAHGIENLLLFSNYVAIITAAREHKVNVFVVDQPPAIYYLNKLGIANDFRISAPVNVGEFHRAVRKGNTNLLQIINSGFAALNPKDLDRINKKWLGRAIAQPLYWRWLGRAALGGAVLVILLIVWNWTLARRVRQRTRELRANQALLQGVVKNSPSAIFIKDLAGKYLLANQHFLSQLAVADPTLEGKSDFDLFPRELAEKYQHDDRAVAESGTARLLEETAPHPDGLHHYFTVKFPLRDSDGRVFAVAGIATDITEGKQAEKHIARMNRVYAVLSDINQTIVREKDPQAMLTAACRIAVEKGGFSLSWIGLVDGPGRRLKITAHAGATSDTLKILETLIGGEQPDCVFTFHALHDGEHGICNDIGRDPQAQYWRTAALKRDYHSMASLPLKVNGEVVGTFNLYSEEPGFFVAEEMRLLDELATDVSFALEVHRREEERRKAEEALRWRTAFFEAQVDSALDGILVVDEQGRKILQNEQMNLLWKIPAHIIENQDDAAEVQFVASRVRNPQPFLDKVTHLYSHPDESSRDEIELVDGRILARTSYPVRGKAGKYYGRIWTFRDITERKRAEESLARLATAVEQSAETIVITDTRGTILYTNPAFEKTTGYTCAEAIGQNPRLFKSGQHEAEYYRRMWEVLGRGEIWSGHFVNRRKDGTLFEEEATITPVRDTAGNVVNYVAVKRDITREKQLEEQFRQSQKMEAIGQLAGGVAHDFNNILAVIMMQAELMALDEQISKETREGLRQIHLAAERAANLTRQLLLFSRKQVMQSRIVDLNEIVTSLTKMLQRILGEDVNLQLNLSSRPMLVRADGGMLDQVLLNIVINARDAMPGGGRLIVETAEETITAATTASCPGLAPGRHVCLRVTDTGSGIAPELLPRIFEPFFTTKEAGKGTGLGLATVFGIVKQHNGSILVESKIGTGTTFKILLPAAAEAEAVLVQGAARPKPRGGTETILLVEDEKAVRMLTRVVLERQGYQVLEAAHGVEALQVWEQHSGPIHLLLTDIVMPEGISGRELATRLQERNARLRVIFTSGYSAEIAGRELALLPGQNFIQKPSAPLEILETVRRCLDGE